PPVVIIWHPTGRGRANALLAVTVVAGFASSIFLPLTGVLMHAYGWRTAALLLAAIHGTITIPLHVLVVRRAPHNVRLHAHHQAHRLDTDRRSAVHHAVRDRWFWLLGLAFVASAAAVSTVSVHLVAYLIEAGHSVT